MKKVLVGLAVVSTLLFGGSVTFQGNKVDLNSDGLKIGDMAPDFYGVKNDLSEVKIGGAKSKVQVIAFVPSIDTGVCAMETIRFNNEISKMKNVELFVVSKDLPFAFGRFCQEKGIKNITTASDYKDSNNALRYGTTISAPAILEGFFARVVYIVDTKGKIVYKEIVPEITNEPNYKKIIKVVNSL